MGISSQEFLDIARSMDRDIEVWRRTAISRAYYAAFHRCQTWEQGLHMKGDDQGRHGVHDRLISRLLNPHPSCALELAECSRRIGQHLLQQRSLRVKADYRLELRLTERMLCLQLRLATSVWTDCSAHPSRRRRAHPRPSANA